MIQNTLKEKKPNLPTHMLLLTTIIAIATKLYWEVMQREGLYSQTNLPVLTLRPKWNLYMCIVF